MASFDLSIVLRAVDKTGAIFDKTSKRLDNVGSSAKKMSGQLALVGGAAVAGFGLAIKGAAAFDKAMREVNTLVNLGEDEFLKLKTGVLDLSVALGVDAMDATQGLYQAISAGIPAENALEFMAVASKTAIGGVTDVKTAVDGLTTVVNAFGMEASDAQSVADNLFVAMKNGKTTIGELSASMATAAPTASALGIDVRDVTAAVSTMTLSGTSTTRAFTQVNSAMTALIRNADPMAKLLNRLGFESGEAALASLGLGGTLQALVQDTGASNVELVKAFQGVEGLRAGLQLSGAAADTFKRIYAESMDAAGAGTTAFEQINKSSARQFEISKAKVERLRIEIGDQLMPIMSELMTKFTGAIAMVTKFTSENPLLTKTLFVLGLAVTAVAVGLGAIGFAASGAAALMAMASGVTAAYTFANTALAASFVGLNLATGGLLLAFAAIVTGIILLIKNWDLAVHAFKTGGNFLIGLAERLINGWLDIYINPLIRAFNKVAGIFGKSVDEIEIEMGRMQSNYGEVAQTVEEKTAVIETQISNAITGFTELADVVEEVDDRIEQSGVDTADALVEALEGELTAKEQLIIDYQDKRGVMDAALLEAEIRRGEETLEREKNLSAQRTSIREEETKRALELIELKKEAAEALLAGDHAAFLQMQRNAGMLPAVIQVGAHVDSTREAAMRAAGAAASRAVDAGIAVSDDVGKLLYDPVGGYGGAPPMLPGMGTDLAAQQIFAGSKAAQIVIHVDGGLDLDAKEKIKQVIREYVEEDGGWG